MMLFSIGIPSFIQVKVSGGEPSEVQDNVRESPNAPLTALYGVYNTGGTAKYKIMSNFHLKIY